MKVNELRIGNYYLEDMTVYAYGDTKIVKQITPYWFYPQDDDDTKEYSFPIPLTEEWLIKFGFEKWLDGVYYIEISNEQCEYNLRIFEDIGHVFIDHNKRIMIDLKHVHQLQNLYFALTNKELTSVDGEK